MSKVMYQSDADRAAAEREFDDKVKSMKRAAAALQRKIKAKRYRNIDAAIRAAGELALDAAADVSLLAANHRSTGDMPANAADVRLAVDRAFYAYTSIESKLGIALPGVLPSAGTEYPSIESKTDAHTIDAINTVLDYTDDVNEAVADRSHHRPPPPAYDQALLFAPSARR